MIRVLFYIAVIVALALGFMWLADRPGDLVLTVSGYQFQTSLLVAAVMLVVVVAAIMITWWIIKGIWHSPYAVSRYFRVRKRDRGYQALSTGLIAAGAGDTGTARRMGKQATKLLSSDLEPLIHLLDAQAAMLEGDYQAAREKFAEMAKDPETRLVGLRGLYIDAIRQGHRAAARQIAEQAAEQSPHLAWAVTAALEERVATDDWSGALSLLDRQKGDAGMNRDAKLHLRAVILTGKAADLARHDPVGAKAAALEAARLAPDFVPAVALAARYLIDAGETRKAARILEAIWQTTPHPQIADIYLHLRPGDATHDRLERARRLRKLRSNNVESELIVARAALDAGELGEARAAAEAAIRLAPREGAYLLLADIEEAETGDQGRVRQYLARALRAPQDPAWVADGVVSDRWMPASPVTGVLDAFEWRVPSERLGPLIEDGGADPLEEGGTLPYIIKDDQQIDDAATDVWNAKIIEPEKAPDHAGVAEIIVPVQKAETSVVERSNAEALADDTESDPDKTVLPPLPDDPGIEPDHEKAPQSQGGFRLF